MSERDAWATPWPVLEALACRYAGGKGGFELDACATASNQKAARFFAPEDDGLKREWSAKTVFCNPPYSDILPWVLKADEETRERRAGAVVMLLPARTDSRWFEVLRRLAGEDRAHLTFTRGRIQFIPPAGAKASTNNAGSLIAAIWPPLVLRAEER